MASLTTQGTVTVNPFLFDNYDYETGFCNSITQPNSLSEFVATEETSLRTGATFSVDFNRICRIKTTYDLTVLTTPYTPTFTGLILVDKTTGAKLALLAIEEFKEQLNNSQQLETVFNLNMVVPREV